MDTESYGEFKLRPAKNGWFVRAFGEMWVYKTDSEVIDALKEHMKQARKEGEESAQQSGLGIIKIARPPRP